MTDKPPYLTHATGAPVSDNLNTLTAGRRGPALLQDVWVIEKLAHFDREVIPERRMHAKRSCPLVAQAGGRSGRAKLRDAGAAPTANCPRRR